MKKPVPKISGFSLVRQGDQFGYPYLEAYRSLLPCVDELVINVGIGEDSTVSRLQQFQKEEGVGKVILLVRDWKLNTPSRNGKILSVQTNLALNHCQHDWCFYLQADEVLHEEDYGALRNTLAQAHQNPKIDGILFNYVHFYGSFQIVQKSRNVYRREVRIIRKSSGVLSIGDAQSFKKYKTKKLQVLHTPARIFHYGWVRPPDIMKEKTFFMDQLYHGAPHQEDLASKTPHTKDNYRYKRILGLVYFQGTHPQVMQTRIQHSYPTLWDFKNTKLVLHWHDWKNILLNWIEKQTGRRLFEYKTYRIHK